MQKKIISLLIVCFFCSSNVVAVGFKNIKNYLLNNPIEYLFSFSKNEVESKLESIYKKKYEHLWGIYHTPKDGIRLSAWPHKSDYHVPLFKITDKDLSNDIDIGRVKCIFHVEITEIAPNKTKVKVTPIPGWYKMFVDSKSGMPFSRDRHSVSKQLPTSTFFEYTFLLKLGELLGEKDMPPINTDITKAKEVVT